MVIMVDSLFKFFFWVLFVVIINGNSMLLEFYMSNIVVNVSVFGYMYLELFDWSFLVEVRVE